MKRLPIIVNIILFVALCMLIIYWAMQIFKPTLRPIAAPVSASNIEPAMGQWGNVFGMNTVAMSAPSQYHLKGVIVATRAKDSAAIIMVDGQPTYAIGVGKELSPGVKLQEVHATHIIVSENGVSKQVDLPPVNLKSEFIIPTTLPHQ